MEQLRGTPTQYEVLRNNRWELQFPTELNIESWLCQMTKYPKLTINSVAIPFLNTEFYVAGIYKWSEFETLTGRQGYSSGYKKNLVLKSLDPTGVAVSQWVMYNCMIKEADFGEADYSNDELKKVKIIVQPDYCELSY
jgi:hypothetical protein